jgi:NADH-quinone oxidoreductase subunit F
MLKRTDYLTKVYGIPNGHTIEVYEREARGYQMARKVLTSMTKEQVVEDAKKANIRGRGGAGFPMGVKWSFMRPHPTKPAYLAINADEGEPGTHKDRTIMEQNPHAVIEGCIIGCFGIGAHVAYIYVRDELHLSKARLEGAIAEAKKKGYLGKSPFGKDYAVEVYVHTGAGAYICGEETAMLNSLEGRRGEPRLKPPFPAQAGAFGCPTTVNNLETIAIVPTALTLGGEEFSKLSALHSINDGGVRLYGINGHVNKPGVVELACGPTINELINEIGGGVLGGKKPLCVIPGVRRSAWRRHHAWRRHDARHVLRDGLGRRHMPRARDAELDAVLPTRIVRSVHAMSRRRCVARSCGRQNPRQQSDNARARSAQRHRQQHHGQHHLRLR